MDCLRGAGVVLIFSKGGRQALFFNQGSRSGEGRVSWFDGLLLPGWVVMQVGDALFHLLFVVVVVVVHFEGFAPGFQGTEVPPHTYPLSKTHVSLTTPRLGTFNIGESWQLCT